MRGDASVAGHCLTVQSATSTSENPRQKSRPYARNAAASDRTEFITSRFAQRRIDRPQLLAGMTIHTSNQSEKRIGSRNLLAAFFTAREHHLDGKATPVA
jgi:hypothetical protein